MGKKHVAIVFEILLLLYSCSVLANPDPFKFHFGSGKTADEPARILLSADRQQVAAYGQDLSHIAIKLVDENSGIVPKADQEIAVEVVGNGKLSGLDNGDLRDPFTGKPISTYFGKALLTVQSGRTKGEMKVKISAEGLPDEVLIIDV